MSGLSKESMEKLAYMLNELDTKIDLDHYTNHHFQKGLYIRELFIPKGVCVVGMEHLCDNFFFVAQGHITLWSDQGEVDVETGFMSKVSAGAQRVAFAHEDTVCFNTFPNPDDETDIDKIEARLFKQAADGTVKHFRTGGFIAAGVAVAGAAYSAYSGAKAGKMSKKAAKKQRQADLMNQFLGRRKMLQEYRQMQAAAQAGASASGAALESSGYQGVKQSLLTQAKYSISSENRILGTQAQAFSYEQKAAEWEGKAAIGAAISSIAGSFVGMGGMARSPTGAGKQSYSPKSGGYLAGSLSGSQNVLGSAYGGGSLTSQTQAPENWGVTVDAGAFKNSGGGGVGGGT